jgi:hypothetical protein
MLVLYVNHFKSKRDGEIDTDLQRIRQAVYLNGLVAARLATDPDAWIIALGDFNDTERSPALSLLSDAAQGGALVNVLSAIPDVERYTYNFGGVSELIDGILLSPALAEEVALAAIAHVNADYPAGWRTDTSPAHLPYRASYHDAPLVIVGRAPATATPVATADSRQPTAAAPTADDRQPTAAPLLPSLPAPLPPAATPTATPTTAPPLPRPPAPLLPCAPAPLLILAGALFIQRKRH